jgi:hypothetical protein
MSNQSKAPSLMAPIASAVAAVCSLVAALFTALGSPPFACALVIFLAVPVVIFSSACQWYFYFHKYVDYRIDQIVLDSGKA